MNLIAFLRNSEYPPKTYKLKMGQQGWSSCRPAAKKQKQWILRDEEIRKEIKKVSAHLRPDEPTDLTAPWRLLFLYDLMNVQVQEKIT